MKQLSEVTTKKYHYEYECPFCLKIFVASKYNVSYGTVTSCGCAKKDRMSKLGKRAKTTHGHGKPGNWTPTYTSWSAMKQRCTDPKHTYYYLYGGRGITICKDWLVFENFLRDMGERPSTDYSIDRIDPDGNYEPGNCRWILKSENSLRIRRREDGSRRIQEEDVIGPRG